MSGDRPLPIPNTAPQLAEQQAEIAGHQARLLTQQEGQREVQRARQAELERIELERDRLAQLQQAQLEQTEMVLSQQREFLDNTQRAEFTDGCDITVTCADADPFSGGRSTPPTGGRGGVSSDGGISSGCFSAEI